MPTQPPNTIAPDALTTLDQVKLWIGKPDVEASQDGRLLFLINAASQAAMRYCGRLFREAATQPQTFTFQTVGNPVAGGYLPQYGWPSTSRYVSFGIHDLQAITSLQVDTDTPSPATITSDAYQLVPPENTYGVSTGIRFYTTSTANVQRAGFGFPRVVQVAGTWGWPAIPADVEQAVCICVSKWFRRDQVTFSEEFGLNPPPLDGSNLPYDARYLLNPFRKMTYA